MGSSADESLVQRVLAGDHEACAQMVRTHHAGVYRLLAYLCRDSHLAEDLAQETFAAAWAGLGAFSGASSLATWLHRIAYRKHLDAQRRRPRMDVRGRSAEIDVVDGSATDPVAAMIADERTRLLYRALGKLPPGERDVLVLHYLDGMTYGEMAEALQTPEGTCKWRTSQAVKRLRRLLADNETCEVQHVAE